MSDFIAKIIGFKSEQKEKGTDFSQIVGRDQHLPVSHCFFASLSSVYVSLCC